MNAPATLTGDPLTVYLNDHLAGAAFGRERVRAAAGANRSTEFGEPLARLAAQIEADRHELLSIVQELGRGRDPLREAGGWLGERLLRLRPNGRMIGYSPLSRLQDLEALEAGVEAKLALWRALRALAPDEPRLDEQRLDRLLARAQRQRRELTRLHKRAAAVAFADRPRT